MLGAHSWPQPSPRPNLFPTPHPQDLPPPFPLPPLPPLPPPRRFHCWLLAPHRQRLRAYTSDQLSQLLYSFSCLTYRPHMPLFNALMDRILAGQRLMKPQAYLQVRVCVVHGVRCVWYVGSGVCGTWGQVCGTRGRVCVVRGVRCVVRGVRCVWYVGSGVCFAWSGVCGMRGQVCAVRGVRCVFRVVRCVWYAGPGVCGTQGRVCVVPITLGAPGTLGQVWVWVIHLPCIDEVVSFRYATACATAT